MTQIVARQYDEYGASVYSGDAGDEVEQELTPYEMLKVANETMAEQSYALEKAADEVALLREELRITMRALDRERAQARLAMLAARQTELMAQLSAVATEYNALADEYGL